MKGLCKKAIAAAMLAAFGITVQASSHREALAILNEPCADNTDTYAWVKPGLHDKLYLIMNFNPLHEPGQDNQGLRACASGLAAGAWRHQRADGARHSGALNAGDPGQR